jgi:superoxide dismutase, Cu-Zn family
MKKIDLIKASALAAVGLSVLMGCGGEDDEETMIASSNNAALQLYADPYAPAMAGTANPIGGTANARAEAYDVAGRLRLELDVAGFPPTRAFGSHLHQLPCEDTSKAGGHYQHTPFPTGGMPTDPTYANAVNEAWLDFTTDANGSGVREVTLDWIPRAGQAQAIIVHDMPSGVGGVSGAKLACLPIAF